MSRKIYSSRTYRRRRKRLRGLLILLLTLVVAAACFLFLFLFPTHRVGETLSGESGDSLPESAASSEPSLDASSEVSAQVSSQPAEPSEPSESSGGGDDDSSRAVGQSYHTISGPDLSGSSRDNSWTVVESSELPEPYDYAQPVPLGDPVEDSYFDQVVFVGNSRTQGFVLYSGLSNLTAYTDKGLTVETAATKEVVPDGEGGKVTVLEALRENGDCKAVYMMFGINELGWPNTDAFVRKYTDLVEAIQQNHPGVEIYLQSILPVGKSRAQEDRYVNNDRIQEYNLLIQELAQEKQVYYLDIFDALVDREGYLPEDAAVDGVHLKKAYCQIWLDYLRTHVAPDLEAPETPDVIFSPSE